MNAGLPELEPVTSRSAGARGTLDDLERALHVVRASTDEVVIGLQRRAAPLPWHLEWPPFLLTGAAIVAGYLGGALHLSWVAVAFPALFHFLRFTHRRRATLTLRRGQRRSQWRRGSVAVAIDWDDVQFEQRLMRLRLTGASGSIEIPFRIRPPVEQMRGAVTYLDDFTRGSARSDDDLPVVDIGFCDSFDFVEISANRLTVRTVDVTSWHRTFATFAASLGLSLVAAIWLAQGGPGWLTMLLLICAPTPVLTIPLRPVTFERGKARARTRTRFMSRQEEEHPFDIEWPYIRRDDAPTDIDVAADRHFLRIIQRDPNPGELRFCTELIRSFAGGTSDASKAVDVGAALELLRVATDSRDALVLEGRLRHVHRPAARAGWVLGLLSVGAVGLLWTVWGPIVVIVPAIGCAAFAARFLLELRRVQYMFLDRGRTLVWRLRNNSVSLTWRRIERTQYGDALTVVTDAGTLSVPLRRRASTPEIAACIAVLENRFPAAVPESHPTGGPRQRSWPEGFTTFLDHFHPQVVSDDEIVFRIGRRGVLETVLVGGVIHPLVAGGALLLEAPPAAKLAVAVVMATWPLATRVGVLVIRRGSRTALLKWPRYETGKLLDKALVSWGLASTDQEGYGLLLKMDGWWFGVPGGSDKREPVLVARRALLEFAGCNVSDDEAPP